MYDIEKMKVFIKPIWVSILSYPLSRRWAVMLVFIQITIIETLKPWDERYSCEDSSHPEVIPCESIISLNSKE